VISNGLLLRKAFLYNYEGEPKQAYAVLEQCRSLAEKNDALAEQALYTVASDGSLAAPHGTGPFTIKNVRSLKSAVQSAK